MEIKAFVDGNTAIAGDGHLTNEQVTFMKDIKNADTPEGMADRIPPRKTTETTVTLNVTLDKGQKIVVDNVGDNVDTTGRVKFHTADGDQFFVDLTKAGANVVQMFGEAQTTPGMTDGKPNAGQLKLSAYADIGLPGPPANRVYSSGFSVAAIPIAMTASINFKTAGDNYPVDDQHYRFLWGAEYTFKIESDSGDPGDLNAVQLKEVLNKGTATGAMVPYAGALEEGGWDKASGPYYDHNWIGGSIAKAKATSAANAKSLMVGDLRYDIDDAPGHNGHWVIDQYFEFYDTRTGMDANHPLIVKASGFKLTYDLSPYVFTIQRQLAEYDGAAPGKLGAAADGEKLPLPIK